MNTRRELEIHARTLGATLHRGARGDARDATQVLDRGAEAVARGAVSCALWL